MLLDNPTFSVEVDEVNRILALPISAPLTPAQVEEISRRALTPAAFNGDRQNAPVRLLPSQAAGLLHYATVGGLFGPIGVGKGKGGLSMLIAKHAFHEENIRKILLIVPAGLIEQTEKSVYPVWRKRTALAAPLIVLSGRSPEQRLRWASSGVSGLYLISYQTLSRPGGLEVFQELAPGLVILDEAHNLSNMESGRGKKFVQAMRDLRPRCVALSGTMTKKRLDEFAHLADLALGKYSPVPRNNAILFKWSGSLDANATEEVPDQSLRKITQWARAYFPEQGPYTDEIGDLRKAFRVRLHSAPGVVATGDDTVPTSLALESITVKLPDDEGARRLRELIAKVENGETPDGELINFAIHKFKWQFELSAGIYNQLVWPDPQDVARRIRMPLESAVEALAMARDHHELQKMLAKETRDFLKQMNHPIATPLEMRQVMVESPSRVPEEIHRLHKAMEAIEQESVAKFGRLVERDRRVIRVCDYKIRAAVDWARKHKVGVIWTIHQGVGEWITEALRQAGLEAIYCGAGQSETLCRLGDPDRGGRGDALVVASLPAHKEGKNLQAFTNQLFVQWCRPAADMEQALGRLHRLGQKADSITAHYLLSDFGDFDDVCVAATLNDAVYVQQLLGTPQKVLNCDWVHMPAIFSPEFLRERGAQPEMLTADQRAMLAEKFGYRPN